MKTYSFHADFINPEIITFNPSYIQKNAIEVIIKSNDIYVRRIESIIPSILDEKESISIVQSVFQKEILKFQIHTGEFHGKYMVTNINQLEGIEAFIGLIS